MSSTTNTNKLMDTEPGGENTQYESQKIFTSAPEKNDEGKAASQFRDDSGTVRLPTHNKMRPADIKTKAEGQQKGEGQSENVADRYRDTEGRVNLPTHRVMRPADIKAKGEEEQELRERGKAGYGGGNDVGA